VVSNLKEFTWTKIIYFFKKLIWSVQKNFINKQLRYNIYDRVKKKKENVSLQENVLEKNNLLQNICNQINTHFNIW